jgi:hypothetical protein
MFHPTFDFYSVETHYNERLSALMKEAEMARLFKKIKAGKPRFQDRLLMKTGDLLISLGLRLKGRYGSELGQIYLSIGQRLNSN